MQTPLTIPTTPTTKPTFSYQVKAPQAVGQSGGLFHVCINGSKVCDAEHWALACCGLATLFNFKLYTWMNPRVAKPGGGWYTNWDYLEEHHDALFNWMCTAEFSDQYIPKEFLMALSDSQLAMLPKMLSHRKVKKIDRFKNKSHGPSDIHIYRVSCLEDFDRK